MIGNGERSWREILGTGQHLRERRHQRVVGTDARQECRHFLAAIEALHQQRSLCIPTPTRFELTAGDAGLHQQIAHAGGREVGEHFRERETRSRSERQQDRLFGCCRFQLETKSAAEAFAQRETPGAVDARAERRMNDELHAAAVIEETLGDDHR